MDDSSDHPRTSDSEFSTYDDSEDGNSDDDSRDGDALTDHPSGSDSDDDREYDKRHGQSDTETRNLLEDADFEEDILDLDHQSAGPSTIREIPVPPVVVEKPKPSSSSASTDFENDVFAISAEQRAYYMTLFQHLQYVVSGESSLDGSVSGSDDRVVSFFLKSGLDTKSLGKIWDLADINVDGRLNRTEFAVAMHLIVLKTKGGVPIPKRLPAIFDLRPTPPRIDEESPMEVINQSFDVRNGLGNVTHNGRPLPTIFPLPISSSTDSGNKMQSLSDDKLHSLSQRNASAFCPVTEFASDPPMCVDRYPLAVRPTPSTNAPQLTGGTVSLGSQQAFAFPSTLPKGPPPQPPPRSYQKGHARSASLDLNARPPVDFGRAGKQATMPTSGITAFPAPPSTTTVFPPPPPPPSSMAQNLHNQRCLTLPAGSRPTFTAPNFNPHDSSVLTSHLQRLGPTVPPPTLRKISAGGDGGVAHSKTFDSSMTSSALTATSSSSSSSKPPHSSPDSAPPSRPPPPLLPQKPDYHSRCATLRQVNAALEAKLATLSQVRLQLRLRYEEVQGKSSGPNNMQ